MLRPFVNALIFTFAVIALAAMMLESINADVIRFSGVRRAIVTWSEWTGLGWSALSDLVGMKIPGVIRSALILLTLFGSLYVSATRRERRTEFPEVRSWVPKLNFVVGFSAVIAIAFHWVLFAPTNTALRLFQTFIGILTTAVSVAFALPAQPHLPVITKGLWIAIAIWTVCVV